MTDGLGRATQQQYDAAGRLVRRTRPDGVATVFEYDAAGRLVAVVENARDGVAADHQTNVRTSYSYDPNGNLLAISDANGHTQRFAYDALNRQVRASDPLSNTQQLFYTARGELDHSIDALGRTTSYTYDALGRVTTIDYPTGTPDVSYAYDAAGNVLTMTDGLGTTSYTYDALHRMESRTRDGLAVSYSYLPTGQVGTLTYWNRGSVVATYDDAGRLATLAPWGAQPTSYTWRATGLPATITRPNGVRTTFSYDAANQLRRIAHQRGATTLNDLGYTLDATGNRTAISEVLGGAPLTTSYQYDPLQRLTQASYPAIPSGPAAQTVPYTLDAAGNRLGDGTTTQSYDAADRIAGYQYDAVGNLLDDGTTSYAYDAANRLIQTTSAGIVTTYGYDGWGTLVRETRAGVTTDFVLDEQAGLPRVLAAIRSDGTEELYAYGPDGLLAQRSISGTDTTSYALLDGQASLKHLTDSAGSLTLTRVYDAWGTVRFTTGTATSRLGYTGELQSGALVYLRARWYHTGLGTFTARDTFAGTPTRPSSLHRYLYTEGNPVNFSDPSGFAVGPDGEWEPCNLLPGRADTCTVQDFQQWWHTDEPAKVGRFGITVVKDLGSALAAIPGLPYQLLTDPQGVAWGVLYSPFQLGEDVLLGTVCGDPERLGHVTSTYGLFVFGGVANSLRKPIIPLSAAKSRILLVGEGDFSFARSLIEHERHPSGKITATSYENPVINPAKPNISPLKEAGVEVVPGVDARKLNERADLGQYDMIVWNFPYQPVSRKVFTEAHQQLLREFFASAQTRLDAGGKVVVTVKNGFPYDSWKIEEQARSQGLRLVDATDFDSTQHPGYTPRQTKTNAPIPLTDGATVYIFEQE